MTRQMKLVIPVLVVLMATAAAAADESLSTARELYAAAAYEDALSMLNRLRLTDLPAVEKRGIEQYRAFCLLALGRTTDAERAIEAVVSAEPSYQPSEAEVSPRLRTAFSDVRKRMLPGIVQDQYMRAKAAFDRKNYDIAASTFKEMLTTLADPAVGPAANQPPLSDLKTLATGFHELSAAAVAPPPPPIPAPPVIAVSPIPAPPPPPIARIFNAQDSDVQAPSVIRQALPDYDKRWGVPVGQQARMDVVISEDGSVELATLRGTIHPKYDEIAVAAARAWRYKPATRMGVPVKFSKFIAIAVKY